METSKETPKAEPAKPAPAPAPAAKTGGKIAVILIRNITGSSGEIRDTLTMLRLDKKLSCSLVENSPISLGMLNKVKDYTAYGEIDDETRKMLEQKRGKKGKDGKLKKIFHLHPPRGGFERKGIKHSYTQGGALGYRGAKINALIKKML
jgi:large subunit ribosomal protein L30